MSKCPICGEKDKCKYTSGRFNYLGGEPLNESDWKEVHEHLTKKFLPFIHKIVDRARQRKKESK